MKLLLDTHTFIWIVSDSSKLSNKVATLFSSEENQVYLSSVNLWEIQIKTQLGKLKLDGTLSDIVSKQISENQLEPLSVNFDHVMQLDNLPIHHKDPFDRLLIAQAQSEELTLLSKDAVFEQYDVQVIW